ncbi:unnamed protein product, partial [Brassica napus]
FLFRLLHQNCKQAINMENLTLLSSSSSSPKLLIGCNFTSSLKTPVGFSRRTPKITLRCSKTSASAQSQSPEKAGETVVVKHRRSKAFASIFSSSLDQQTTSVAYPSAAVPPPSSSSSTIGSPLFWIGVGVGLSALFSWATSNLKKYAMQTAMKTMMNQMNTQNSQFNNPGFPTGPGSGSPFPFPFPPQTTPTPSPFQSQSQSSSATVDVTATQVDTPPSTKPQPTPVKNIEVDKPSVVLEENKPKKEEKNYAFEDVSPEETAKESPFSNYAEVSETSAPKEARLFEDVLQNGSAPANGATASEVFQSLGAGKGGPGLSVEALEKMMEDPTVQKMVYPHLPEEMRNPETFKWMLQNPQYRQQLQDMLNNMSGSGEWDKRMTETLKNFDLNSPEVKQQFDQIGLTPEEVISKIMQNPDVAMAFQNPRVQAALMECSENPMNIMKYQNDKEVNLLLLKMKPLIKTKDSKLSAASRAAVNKVLDRINARGNKKSDDTAQNCDSAKLDKGKQTVTDNDLQDRERGQFGYCDDDEEMNDSDWEDCPIPSPAKSVDVEVDDNKDLTIELDDLPPDDKRQKNTYRATGQDKERAELVHKVHLLCLLARGRIVDNACNDPLIQASLLSLLPSYLTKIPNLGKVTVRDVAPLLRWVRGNFAVRCTPSSEKSFRTSLAFALESRRGTSEELGALSVALLRALKLTTRFVSILDVASLKPGADKDESPGPKRAKTKRGIFRNSTLMVPKQQAISSHQNKSSSHAEDKSLSETSEPQLQDNKDNSSCEAGTSSKSEGIRRRGDVEFEMQLAMALAATATVNNNQQSSEATEKKKTTKASDGLSIPDQVMSTAFGSKKVDSPLCWAEVYCNGENMDGRWVHVDALNGTIDAEQNVEAAASACKMFLRYVVAFSGGGAKDVTRRYCTKWHTISSKRVNSSWWDMVLAPLRELEAASSLIPLANRASSSSFGVSTAVEDIELATRALTEPLPTNQQAYKSHELYAIEKWLHKNQILHPKGPVLGFCAGHCVYPRTCVQTLRTKESWLRDGLQLKSNEVPLKILKRNAKVKKVKDFGDGNKDSEDGSRCMELYGKWQMEPLCLPHAVNGIVPKNERGQVDVWSEKCLPPGTVHLRFPRIFSIAKRFGIDYAPAMVGFEYKSGRVTPVFEGIVVCTEFKDTILEAYAEERAMREEEERKRNEAQAASRWYQLLSSILTRERLKNRYANNSEDDVVKTRSLETKPETVVREENVKTPKKQGGVKRGRSGGRKSRSEDENRERGDGEGDEHEHVFLDEEETFDEKTSVKTKRCKCGFSVQVEQMYIGVGEEEQVQLFYYFIKSEKNPKEDPLLIWLSGGPGCSSATGLFFENGPVTFNVEEGYNEGSGPALLSTTHSWTKVANIIFLDQPVGTGFSYATTQLLDTPSDSGEAKQIHEFIRKWLSKHTEFISNPFYVAGDSYSGKIIPATVQEISKGNDLGFKPQVNLEGYVLGNPVTDFELDHNHCIPFAHGMALISDELYESLKRNCKGNYENIDPHNTECLKHHDKYLKCISSINVVHILMPRCDPPLFLQRRFILLRNVSAPLIADGCYIYTDLIASLWANDESVRKALHVVKGSIEKWVRCSSGKPYDFDIKSSVPYHMNNSIKGYRSIIFSGDHDLVVPFPSTQAWIRSLGYSIIDEWRPWMVHNQIAGYTRTYANNMTYATVKASGHTLEFKPNESFIMFQRWISGQPL